MNATPEENTQALPSGTRIEEFVIERVLGSGGFGITYLARDTALGRQVVIKENLPVQFAFRDPGTLTVSPRHTTGEDAENFAWSLENFSKEAAMLASLDHPGVVKVHRLFDAHGTSFFVMPFVEGVSFDEVIRSRTAKGQPFSAGEIMELLEHVLGALAYLHDRKIFHRDIKPGNLLITDRGVPVLIDFGSARQRLSERSMTVVESPGYTPFEQLQSRGKVGSWSDLYALGATLARALTGETLPRANDRAFDDPWMPLARRPELLDCLPTALLASIDRALEPQIQYRWQDAAEWSGNLRVPEAGGAQAGLAGRERAQVFGDSRAPSSSVDPHPGEERAFALCESHSILMCWIPPGRFLMGSPDDEEGRSEHEGPVHQVTLTCGFWLAKYPLTQSQWQAVMGNNPSRFKGDDLPVESVSWNDIAGPDGFLGKVNSFAGDEDRFFLPTEAQWEYACRAGSTETYAGDLQSMAWYEANSGGKTHPVGIKKPNAWGLHDMHGNVWEWCADRFGPYPDNALIDPQGMPSGSNRVLRGGSWLSNANYCRSAFRNHVPPGGCSNGIGFRPALRLVP